MQSYDYLNYYTISFIVGVDILAHGHIKITYSTDSYTFTSDSGLLCAIGDCALRKVPEIQEGYFLYNVNS
jgi:hypothetical protein